jgi:hypothetical protein
VMLISCEAGTGADQLSAHNCAWVHQFLAVGQSEINRNPRVDLDRFSIQ